MKIPVLIAAASLLILPGASSAQTTSFCSRMATQLGMQPIERGRQGETVGEWRVNILSGLSSLFGGSALVSFGSSPVGNVTDVAEYARLQKVCEQIKKTMMCRVEGPMKFIVSTGKGKAEVEALPGERAEVEMKGTGIYCRDPSAFKRS